MGYGSVDGAPPPHVWVCMDSPMPFPPLLSSQSPAPQRLLDVGCSAGISTRFLKKAFPQAKQVQKES